MVMADARSRLRCAVCAEEDAAAELIVCTGCGVCVHRECYTVPGHKEKEEEVPFACQVCKAFAGSENDAKQRPSCTLCNRGGGALVASAEGGWVHGVCALFAPGVALVPDGDRLIARGVLTALEKARADASAAKLAAATKAEAKAAKAKAAVARVAAAGRSPRSAVERGSAEGPWAQCPHDSRCVRPARHVGRCRIDRLSGVAPASASGSTSLAPAAQRIESFFQAPQAKCEASSVVGTEGTAGPEAEEPVPSASDESGALAMSIKEEKTEET
jgi:hypothetical protein